MMTCVSSSVRKRPIACHTTLSRISSLESLKALCNLPLSTKPTNLPNGHHVGTQPLKLHPCFVSISHCGLSRLQTFDQVVAHHHQQALAFIASGSALERDAELGRQAHAGNSWEMLLNHAMTTDTGSPFIEEALQPALAYIIHAMRWHHCSEGPY